MHDPRHYLLSGVFPIFGASVLWALGYFARKMALSEVSPLVLTALTSVIVTAFMVVAYRLNIRRLWYSFRGHWLKFTGLGLFGVVFAATLMFVGLDHLDLGVATLLEKLQPIFTAVLAALFLKEYFPRKLVPYCIAALVFSYFIAVPDPLHFGALKADWYGIGAVVGAAFFWAVAGVIGKSLMGTALTPPEITAIRFAVSSVFLLPVLVCNPVLCAQIDFSLYVWCIIFLAAIFSTGFGYILYYKGLKWVDASTAAFLELVTPVVSLLLGIVFLSEILTFTQCFAVVGLLYAVYVISVTPRKRL